MAEENGNLINLGLGKPLQIEISEVEGRFRSALVGLEPEAFLIVRAPRVVGLRSAITERTEVTVRYVHDGAIYGFRTPLLHLSAQPSPLLFLAYPGQVESHNLRTQDRVVCYLPASLKQADEALAGLILDLSLSGCRFTSRLDTDQVQPPVQGDKVLVEFSPPLNIEAAPGVVRTVSEDEDQLEAGIQFDRLAKAAAAKITKYIELVSAQL